MENKLIKYFESVVKSIDEGTYTITAVVSTKKVDRHGDVVEPEAFRKRMKTFKDHPVLLSSHDYWSLRSQIGEVAQLTITDDGLEAKMKYYVNQGNAEADWAWVLAKNQIASFSIGFIGHEKEAIKDKEHGYTVGYLFKDVELLEISQVLIPANKDALQMEMSARKTEDKMLEMALKGFEAGTLQPIKMEKKEEKPAEQPAEPAAQPADDKTKHYSEDLLAKGGKDHKPIAKEELADAIKSAVSSVLNKK